MPAGSYDIYIEQGATFLLTLTLKDKAKNTLDLTGLEFRGKIKKAFTDVAAQVSFTCTVLDQLESATKGKIQLSLTATQTAALAAAGKGTTRTITSMVYDLESQDVSGVVRRWLEGAVRISPEVTT